MLSLDIWSNAESTRDGAVLQYSDDGTEWHILVGNIGDLTGDPKEQIGLNWYNEKGLVSQPGSWQFENTIGSNESGFGWTGIDTVWRNARFPLDSIKDLGIVSFRVAFSSDHNNPDDTNYDGFAFDNFEIRERTHNVLIEHFDNLNNTNKIKLNEVNALAQRFEKDLIPIQFHNKYPSEDIIYQNNKYPVETRGSVYNINEAPRAFMDGIKPYDFDQVIIEDYHIINRSLSDPLFDIELDIIPTDTVSKVNIRITITANDTISEEIIVYIMPVETSILGALVGAPAGVDSLNNVVKDMLPAGGYPYYIDWDKGMSRSFILPWDLNYIGEENIIYDKSKLGVVAFVQNDVNEGSREVYQSAFAKLPELERYVVAGVEDELNVRKFEDATIYPNPAENYFTVSVSEYITTDLEWSIIDQRGVRLLQGAFRKGEDTFEIDAKGLPVGLHMFIVTSGTEYKSIRKIIIQR
jgi:hypothetical protein